MATALKLFPSNVKMVKADGTGTPEFIRALAVVSDRLGGTGGSGTYSAPSGGVNVGAFTMNTVAAGGPVSRRWEYPNTNPAGWNVGAGTLTFNGYFTTNSYWAANPNGHFGICLRTDMDMIATATRFHGVIFGMLTGNQEGAPYSPSAQIESVASGLSPGLPNRYLFPNSWSPQSKLMTDGIEYRIEIKSKVTPSEQRRIGYKLERWNTAHSAWDVEVDTGDMTDANEYLDMTKFGLVFFSVFEDNLVPWTITWRDTKVTWGPAEQSVTDATDRLNRYGAELAGNLEFDSGARRIKMYCTGATFPNWTAFQAVTTDGPTSLLSIPNGTSTVANFLAANNSGMVNFAYTSLGMNSTRAKLEMFSVGTATTPPLDVVSGGSTMFSVEPTTGLTFPAARQVNVYCTSATWSDWTAFKSQTLNGATTVMAIPNGTSTTANFLATNNPGRTNFAYASFGMAGTRARLETLGVGGAASPDLDIAIGLATHAVSQTGIKLQGKTAEIGPASTRLTGLNNLGGANAAAFVAAAFNYENPCTPGYIAGILTTAGMAAASANAVETVLRPVYCHLSLHFADGQANGTA